MGPVAPDDEARNRSTDRCCAGGVARRQQVSKGSPAADVAVVTLRSLQRTLQRQQTVAARCAAPERTRIEPAGLVLPRQALRLSTFDRPPSCLAAAPNACRGRGQTAVLGRAAQHRSRTPHLRPGMRVLPWRGRARRHAGGESAQPRASCLLGPYRDDAAGRRAGLPGGSTGAGRALPWAAAASFSPPQRSST